MPNVIMLWKGSIATIPSGAYLCNGSNGTPDFRDYFIVCAGGGYAQGATGGSNTKTVGTHTHTIASHNHTTGTPTVNASTSYVSVGGASGYDYLVSYPGHTHSLTLNTSGSATATANAGGSASLENRPLYYSLAYIMLNVDWCAAGVIAIATGASAPTGWTLCDGSGGTPNLSGRFIVAAGNTYAVGATGGSNTNTIATHTHTAGHSHPYGTSSLTASSGTNTVAGGTTSASAPSHTHNVTGTSNASTGNTGTGTGLPSPDNRPLYKAYYYIQKT